MRPPRYIATQGPLPNTTADFWRMIWHFEVKVVVNTCRVMEGGRKKCEEYAEEFRADWD